MSDNRVTQRDISTNGDVAAGNIDKSTNSVFNFPAKKSPLASIIAKYEAEAKTDSAFSSIIEKLQHWHDPDPVSEILGVKEKLIRGHREDLIEFAVRAKEIFSKCLARHQQSKAAQEMFAYVLGSIWQKFNLKIKPRIIEGRTNEEIDALIQSEIILPIEEMLDTNPLGIDPSEISGMVFFLTGNCHLTWE